MASKLMDWDELHIIREDAVRFIQEASRKKPSRNTIHGFCDYLEFILCLIYAYGWKDAETVVGAVTMRDGLDDKAVNLEIEGETFRDRVAEQIDLLSAEGLLRIIDTEAHRDYNTGVFDAGTLSGKNVMKRWNTMLDDRVRDQHSYLEGVTVGLMDEFYTYDGDHALYPGGFGVPELDINCRCYITLTA